MTSISTNNGNSTPVTPTLRYDDTETTPLPFKQVIVIFIGVSMVYFLASLDATIVVTATPAVASSLGGLDKVSWIATAYLLTSTIFSPLFGWLSDIFGRRSLLLLAVIFFLGGSAICGGASSMPMLIIGRAVAGIGGGAINSLGVIIVSEIVSLRDRGKYQGILITTFAISSVIGPLLGGAFTDHISWRWVFYINLPLGAASMLIIMLWLKLPPPKGSMVDKLKKIDYVGTLLVSAATVCLLLALSWGGQSYAWSSPIIISLLVVSAVLSILFVVVEFYLASQPIMPRQLFHHRNVFIPFILYFFLGMAFMVGLFYVPLWYQAVRGESATISGLKTLPMVLGGAMAEIAIGFLISATGYTVPFIMLGSICITVGTALMGSMTQSSLLSSEIGYMVLAGLGVGISMQPILFAAQATARKSDLATATSMLFFFRVIGSVIGVATCGTIFNGVLTSRLYKYIPDITEELVSSIHSNIYALYKQDKAIIAKGQHAFADALSMVFYSGTIMGGISFLLCIFLDWKRVESVENRMPENSNESKDNMTTINVSLRSLEIDFV
ncbi:major facilitator superfamily domain-containing protein [Syncephalis fuscata]|nr:major facilitator superfamily domain-containing protein [Syncephalis fuscata]